MRFITVLRTDGRTALIPTRRIALITELGLDPGAVRIFIADFPDCPAIDTNESIHLITSKINNSYVSWKRGR